MFIYEWTYTADGDLFRKNGTIVAKRKRQVTAYSLWKQNKTDNEISACVRIEKNTKPYAQWKCLEKDQPHSQGFMISTPVALLLQQKPWSESWSRASQILGGKI